MVPSWLAVLLVAKALTHLEIFVKPVSKHLPQTIAHPRILAIVLLVAICFGVGLAIQTAIGAQIKRAAERLVLDKIPGYTTLHGFAARLSDSEESASFQPALVEMEEAVVPAFIVERHSRREMARCSSRTTDRPKIVGQLLLLAILIERWIGPRSNMRWRLFLGTLFARQEANKKLLHFGTFNL